MAEADFNAQRNVVSDDDLKRVEGRISDLYQSIVAMHDICDDCISTGGEFENYSTAVTLLQALLRGAARDLGKCVDVLNPQVGLMTDFEAHFGAI